MNTTVTRNKGRREPALLNKALLSPPATVRWAQEQHIMNWTPEAETALYPRHYESKICSLNETVVELFS